MMRAGAAESKQKERASAVVLPREWSTVAQAWLAPRKFRDLKCAKKGAKSALFWRKLTEKRHFC